MFSFLFVFFVFFVVQSSAAEPQLERPTLRSLGVYWIVEGDGQDTVITLDYRKTGDKDFRPAMPLFHSVINPDTKEKPRGRLDIPPNHSLFAGSIVLLDPDTPYDLRLTLKQPGRPDLTKSLSARTRAEPLAPRDAPVRHVIPGAGGGAGTSDDPFKGLAAAHAAAQPGDILLLHPGTYEGMFDIRKSGSAPKPIIWRGQDRDKVILDGLKNLSKRVISASSLSDVWFENLTIRNADYGIVAHDATRLVLRNCRIHNVDYGFTATRDDKRKSDDFFIADNVFEGPSNWPRTKGIENARGVQVTGAGHVIAHNLFRGFADAVDTFNSPRCEAIDIHNNDIWEMTDDGIEMDYSQRNTRCFENRLTNVFQGISVQPTFGGPVYIFRNVMYNVAMEPFKIHNSPSGAIFYHNTVVKSGPPLLIYTRERAFRLVSRNNLFVGTSGGYAAEIDSPMRDCDFDYDGFAYPAGAFKNFLKWNGQRYHTIEDTRSKAPIWKHAVEITAPEALFATGAGAPAKPDEQFKTAPDLRLKPGSSPATDAGQNLPNFNSGFQGKAPDLGAYETAAPLPQYGPRPGPALP